MPEQMTGRGYQGPPPGKEESTESGDKSALLPKSLFEDDIEPGDTITLKVDAVYEDEVECSVSSEPTETEESPMTADEEIEAAGMEME